MAKRKNFIIVFQNVDTNLTSRMILPALSYDSAVVCALALRGVVIGCINDFGEPILYNKIKYK